MSEEIITHKIVQLSELQSVDEKGQETVVKQFPITVSGAVIHHNEVLETSLDKRNVSAQVTKQYLDAVKYKSNGKFTYYWWDSDEAEYDVQVTPSNPSAYTEVFSDPSKKTGERFYLTDDSTQLIDLGSSKNIFPKVRIQDVSVSDEKSMSDVNVGNEYTPVYIKNGIPIACKSSGEGTQGYTGLTGSTGARGTQGATGAQGPTGYQGKTGAQGKTGIQGANNTTRGTQGPAGSNGLQGFQGRNGIQGGSGIQGSNGLRGAQGPAGAQGGLGCQGREGVQGKANLLAGTQGPKGKSGADGFQGEAGAQGKAGAQGASGKAGAQGATGLQGTAGSQGRTGLQGANNNTRGTQGPAGRSGEDGFQGRAGVQGKASTIQGVTGERGTQGPAGLQGALGCQGREGLQGKANSLGGTQGPRGTQGASGLQGPTGFSGKQGAQGAQGAQESAQGARGLQGANGYQGETGISGKQGAQGVQGKPGYQGVQGNQGYNGESGIQGPTGAFVYVDGVKLTGYNTHLVKVDPTDEELETNEGRNVSVSVADGDEFLLKEGAHIRLYLGDYLSKDKMLPQRIRIPNTPYITKKGYTQEYIHLLYSFPKTNGIISEDDYFYKVYYDRVSEKPSTEYPQDLRTIQDFTLMITSRDQAVWVYNGLIQNCKQEEEPITVTGPNTNSTGTFYNLVGNNGNVDIKTTLTQTKGGVTSAIPFKAKIYKIENDGTETPISENEYDYDGTGSASEFVIKTIETDMSEFGKLQYKVYYGYTDPSNGKEYKVEDKEKSGTSNPYYFCYPKFYGVINKDLTLDTMSQSTFDWDTLLANPLIQNIEKIPYGEEEEFYNYEEQNIVKVIANESLNKTQQLTFISAGKTTIGYPANAKAFYLYAKPLVYGSTGTTLKNITDEMGNNILKDNFSYREVTLPASVIGGTQGATFYLYLTNETISYENLQTFDFDK